MQDDKVLNEMMVTLEKMMVKHLITIEKVQQINRDSDKTKNSKSL